MDCGRRHPPPGLTNGYTEGVTNKEESAAQADPSRAATNLAVLGANRTYFSSPGRCVSVACRTAAARAEGTRPKVPLLKARLYKHDAVSGPGPRRWRLRREPLLAALIALALAAPAVLLGDFVRGTVQTDVATRSTVERQRAAELASRLVDDRLRAAGESLKLLATRSALKDAIRRRDEATLAGQLENVRGASPNYTTAAAFDARGVLLASDPAFPEFIGSDFSARDYFVGGTRSLGPFVSEAFRSAAAVYPVLVTVSLAVREGEKILGLVILSLSPAQVLATLEPIERVAGRELLIVDKRGQVIASTDAQRPPLSMSDLPALARALENGVGTTAALVGGTERIVTYAGLPSGEWALYLVDDPAVVLAVERRLENDITLAASAAGLVAFVLGVAVTALCVLLMRQRDELSASRASLVEANARLEEASLHKSQFLSNMSHELRTPLNAILGFSDLLQEQVGGTLSERQRHYLSNIRAAGQHLVELINDVLDLSKVEAGRVELHPETTGVAALLEPVVAAAAQQAAAQRAQRFDEAIQEDGYVRVDVARIRQVLYNLLSNAVKFTPAGGRVSVSAGLHGDDLLFGVADTGIGIPADRADRVFGMFERLHEERADTPGSGLGLALTKRLVELHGGSISFESREGQGTTFRVRIPAVSAQAVSGRRLLVVEDSAHDADLIVELAEATGLRTEVVASASGAAAAIKRNPPVAVVLDLRLRDQRGERVLEMLKTDPATRDVPVIVVSVEDDEGRLQSLGADEHLTKPIDRSRFAAWLLRVKDRSEAAYARAAG